MDNLELKSGLLSIAFLENGAIERITYDKTQCIDLYRSDVFSGSVNNIYLRDKKSEEVMSIIANPKVSFYLSKSCAIYRGSFRNNQFELKIYLKNMSWFYSLEFMNIEDEITVFYGQSNFLSYFMANEAYASQYLDHHFDNNSKTIITRQNQGMKFSLLEGSFSDITGYSTDAFQFFGKTFKFSGIPYALKKGCLESKNYQYESSYTAMSVDINNTLNHPIVFFNDLIADYSKEKHVKLQELKKMYASLPKEQSVQIIQPKMIISKDDYFNGLSLNKKDIVYLYPKRENEELNDNSDLIAFFKPDSTHVVLEKKEFLLERPSANILISSGVTKNPEKTYSAITYMNGVFLSHLVFGNSNMNKFIGTVKDPLSLNRLSGVRIFIKNGKKYQEMMMPSSFEMRASSSVWIYKLEEDYLKFTTSIAYNNANLLLSFESLKHKKYEFLVINEMVMGPDESNNIMDWKKEDKEVNYHFDKDNLAGKLASDFSLRIAIQEGRGQFYDSSILFEDKKMRGNYLVLNMSSSSSFTVSYQGLINDQREAIVQKDQMVETYENNFIRDTIKFKIESEEDDITSFNHLVYWFSHDALVHYSSPHGLEQYGGAAWGTRDVLQGPVEFFRTIQNYEMVRYIILRVFERQFCDTYDWPQWFMFDNYRFIEAQDSASDIAIWPIKTLSDYINDTNDRSILSEIVHYTNRNTGDYEGEDKIQDHVHKAVEHIRQTFIQGYNLPSYGNGDWDDTLNPVDRNKAKRMVSPWTSSLFIQALESYEGITHEYPDLIESMKRDYHDHLIKDGIVAGFVRFDKDGPHYLLHPSDNETGLKYRLLPITRNMIAETMDKNLIKTYLKIIDKYLMYPDGVRLMDNTVKYHGGSSKIFMRAESAANFGREISLLYVHAHIRYIEAMSHLGLGKRMYDGLIIVNPVSLRKRLSNAEYRQSNSYFSSSDAEFMDRYIANTSIRKIKTQKVKVKGGWRIYSSGPGIYLYELISNFLGIKKLMGNWYFDPIVSKEFNDVVLNVQIHGMNLQIHYHVEGPSLIKVMVNNKEIGEREYINAYRKSGIKIDNEQIHDNDIIDLYLGEL